MYITDQESRIICLAVQKVLNSKRDIDVMGCPTKSMLIELKKMSHENNSVTGYIHNGILNAIVRPLAQIFFLSHTPMDTDVVEELAKFIEIHTVDIIKRYE